MSNPFQNSSSPFGTSFGTQPSNQSQKVFGESTPFGSPFGQSPVTNFGSSAFGSGSTNTAFGAPTTNTAFGAPTTYTTFGAPTTNTAFGAPTTNTAFGAPASSSAFGSGSNSTGFGAGPTTTGFGGTGGFGGTSAGSGFKSGAGGFGTGSVFGTNTASSGFGIGTSNTVSGFGTGLSGSTTGQGFGPGGFGHGPSAVSSSGGFAGGFPASSTTGGFASGSVGSTSSGFGQPSAFGKTAGFGNTTQSGGTFGTTLSTSSGFGTAGGFGQKTGEMPFGQNPSFGATNKQVNTNVQMSSSSGTVASAINSQPSTGIFGQTNVFSSQANPISINAKEAFGTTTSSAFGISTSAGIAAFGTGSGSAPFGVSSAASSKTFGGVPSAGSGSFGAPNQSTGPQRDSLNKSSRPEADFAGPKLGSAGLFGKNTNTQLFSKPGPSTSAEGGGATSRPHPGFGSEGEDIGPGSSDDKGEIKGLVPPASKFILRASAPRAIQSTSNESFETLTSTSKKSLFSADAGGAQRHGASQVLFGKAIAGTHNKVWKRSSDGEEGRKIKRKSSDGTEEENQAKRTTLARRLSVVDDKDRVALICKNVPPRFNNSQRLRQHFSNFGEVSRVFPKPEKGMATIHFKTHEGALEAKRKGAVVMKGEKRMELFWSSYSPSGKARARQSSTEDMGGQPSGPIKRQAQDKPGISQYKWKRNDVADELSSMSGTGEQQQTLSRPAEVKVQQSQPTERAARHSSPVPSTSGSALPSKVDKGAIFTLKSSTARNNSDKLHILNLRDKVNRIGSKKQSDLATAKAFVGTCTDMCPEKERYDREEKRRLHNYEVLQGTEGTGNPQVNHSLAVKEYSRSSADQEEPLPYELRTLPTLTLTMTYLLSQIADRGEDGKWGDWFDFLWNRTRGIRKV